MGMGKDLMEPLLEELRHTNETVMALVEEIKRDGGIVQKVVIQNESKIVAWQIASVCACFFTVILLLVTVIFGAYIARGLQNDMRDQKAWLDVHQAKIARLEAVSPQKEKH